MFRARLLKAGKLLLRFLAVLLVTLVVAVGVVYGMMLILVRGPSPAAAKLFVHSVRETSAVYWLADLVCTPEMLAAMDAEEAEEESAGTDTALIQLPSAQERDVAGTTADAWGLTDEDGDGIILEKVKGPAFVGYMRVVLDPSRLMLGTPEKFGGVGLTPEEMCLHYGCVAGINGGGFYDPDGKGSGGIPEGMTVVNGEIINASEYLDYVFVGFDENYIMHVGRMRPAEVRERGIRFGCTFGPVLIINGERAADSALVSGINPRTAIGQRSDGAVLMLVIDGRQPHSLGATYGDLADIMQSYGAVNAFNLDGGSSSILWYNGGYVNRGSSVIGVRPLATAFLVKEASE